MIRLIEPCEGKDKAMKVNFACGDQKQEIAAFIYQKNNQTGDYCHLCPREYDEIQKGIQRILNQSRPSLLVIRDEEDGIQGVFRVIAEPENKYLEMLWGFARDRSVYQILFDHFRSVYSGYHLDAVVTKVNRVMYEEYQKQGLQYDVEQIMMTLEHYTPKPVDADIVRYSPVYESSFRAIHDDEGCYWTAERMLGALDRYDVFLAVEDGQAVGYIEMTTGFDENEPIQLLVREDRRGKGYGRALLQTAIEANLPKKTVLEVYANNTPALNLYLSLGFRETLREYTGSMTV